MEPREGQPRLILYEIKNRNRDLVRLRDHLEWLLVEVVEEKNM